MTITQSYELETVSQNTFNNYLVMSSALARFYPNLVLTTVLKPRCALCDEHHCLPDRLCLTCKISIASAEREGFAGGLSVSSIGPYQRSGLANRTFSRYNEQQQQSKNLGALDTVVSAFNYQGSVPDLITRWKYQGMIELTDYIAELVAKLTAKGKLSLPDHNLVTVIPSHWQRRLTRGFDPVWLLANALAKKGVIDRPLSTLKASRRMPCQHLKHLNERYIDPNHFQAAESVFGKKILLVDDVVTSGSTLNAAAAALRDAGAQSISGFTIAVAKTTSIALDEIAEK